MFDFDIIKKKDKRLVQEKLGKKTNASEQAVQLIKAMHAFNKPSMDWMQAELTLVYLVMVLPDGSGDIGLANQTVRSIDAAIPKNEALIIFALRDDQWESLMPHIEEVFSDKYYCILTYPSIFKHSESTLIAKALASSLHERFSEELGAADYIINTPVMWHVDALESVDLKLYEKMICIGDLEACTFNFKSSIKPHQPLHAHPGLGKASLGLWKHHPGRYDSETAKEIMHLNYSNHWVVKAITKEPKALLAVGYFKPTSSFPALYLLSVAHYLLKMNKTEPVNIVLAGPKYDWPMILTHCIKEMKLFATKQKVCIALRLYYKEGESTDYTINRQEISGRVLTFSIYNTRLHSGLFESLLAQSDLPPGIRGGSTFNSVVAFKKIPFLFECTAGHNRQVIEEWCERLLFEDELNDYWEYFKLTQLMGELAEGSSSKTGFPFSSEGVQKLSESLARYWIKFKTENTAELLLKKFLSIGMEDYMISIFETRFLLKKINDNRKFFQLKLKEQLRFFSSNKDITLEAYQLFIQAYYEKTKEKTILIKMLKENGFISWDMKEKFLHILSGRNKINIWDISCLDHKVNALKLLFEQIQGMNEENKSMIKRLSEKWLETLLFGGNDFERDSIKYSINRRMYGYFPSNFTDIFFSNLERSGDSDMLFYKYDLVYSENKKRIKFDGKEKSALQLSGFKQASIGFKY